MADQPDLDITLSGLDAALRKLDFLAKEADKTLARAFYRIGTLMRDTAREYAPRSPTDTDLRRAAKRAGRTRRRRARKPRSTSARKPGGLENSIEFRAGRDDVEIFVAANSDAGAYAFKIHSEKGVSWQERGIGTVSKGEKADDRFIERAIEDEADAAFRIIENEIDKILLAT